MARKLGRGDTPSHIRNLLKAAVEKKSQNVVAREIGVGVAVVNRYLKGIGEPTTETLQKLADYFGMPVWVLRGEEAPAEVSEGLYRLAQPYVERYKKITGITELPEGFSMGLTYKDSEITSISINGVDVSESDLVK